jgi:hypothetical protein
MRWLHGILVKKILLSHIAYRYFTFFSPSDVSKAVGELA